MHRESQRAAGVVLYRDDAERRYLLLRSALTRRPVWEFPKGGIEEGETEQEAAERELREESGLAQDDYRIVAGFREEEHYFFTRGAGPERRLVSKQVTYFMAQWHTGEVQISHESSRFCWATYAEAERLLRFPQKRRVLERAERRLSE